LLATPVSSESKKGADAGLSNSLVGFKLLANENPGVGEKGMTNMDFSTILRDQP
jgi:hypothetical protein